MIAPGTWFAIFKAIEDGPHHRTVYLPSCHGGLPRALLEDTADYAHARMLDYLDPVENARAIIGKFTPEITSKW